MSPRLAIARTVPYPPRREPPTHPQNLLRRDRELAPAHRSARQRSGASMFAYLDVALFCVLLPASACLLKVAGPPRTWRKRVVRRCRGRHGYAMVPQGDEDEGECEDGALRMQRLDGSDADEGPADAEREREGLLGGGVRSEQEDKEAAKRAERRRKRRERRERSNAIWMDVRPPLLPPPPSLRPPSAGLGAAWDRP